MRSHDEPTMPSVPSKPKHRVLLVGWDAADWKIISPMLDRGELPYLERLINRGVMADLMTLRPALSPMLWNSIASGQRPERHGILGFGEVDEATNTVRAVSSTSRRCKALWNIVTQCGGRAHVVNWYASHPAEPIRGYCISEALSQNLEGAVPAGAVHPPEASEEFAEFRLRPDEIDVGTLRLFVPQLEKVDQDRDQNLIRLAQLLAESFTVHNAATRVLDGTSWDFAAVYYPGIDHFSHGFMHFHPPKLPHVSQQRFELYSNVIAGAYRLHDLFLGRLLELAGPGASVVLLSDHGFHSDHLRPKPIPGDPVGAAVQHRDHGILVMAGEGIKQDERIYGAGLLDIAPTVLMMLGLPVGGDMPGRVLVDAFSAPPQIEWISSWEQVAGEDGRHPRDYKPPSSDQGLVLEQFAALGYLDLIEMQGSRGPDACRRENDWNLAQSLIDAGQLECGADLLLDLCPQWPQRAEFGVLLSQTLGLLDHSTEARQVFEAVLSRNPETPEAAFLQGLAELDDRNFAAGLERLKSVSTQFADRPDFQQRLGATCLRVGQMDEADAAFWRSVELDPNDPAGWIGGAKCAMRRRNWSLAEQLVMRAIQLDFNRPWPHAILGMVRLRSGCTEEADGPLAIACRLAPSWVYPRRLRALCLGRLDKSGSHAATEVQAAVNRQAQVKLSRAEFLTPERREKLQAIEYAYRDWQRERQQAIGAKTLPPLDLVVVSGLPRSGTSLMMQMLQAGGASILTDGVRVPDIDNPEGYQEWEAIKRLPTHPEVLQDAAGKTVKIVSPLLGYLPPCHHYRVIFVDRPIDEVVQSQLKMRVHRGEENPPDGARLREALVRHRAASLALLKRSPNVEVLVAPYPDLVDRPTVWSNRVAKFLGSDICDAERMAQVVRSDLYRNRCVERRPTSLASHLESRGNHDEAHANIR